MDTRDLILFAMAALVAVLGLWWMRVVAAALAGSVARLVGRGAPGEHPARALLSADWLAVTVIVPLAAWPLWPAGDDRAVLAPTASELAGPDAYAADVADRDGPPVALAQADDERMGVPRPSGVSAPLVVSTGDEP